MVKIRGIKINTNKNNDVHCNYVAGDGVEDKCHHNDHHNHDANQPEHNNYANDYHHYDRSEKPKHIPLCVSQCR